MRQIAATFDIFHSNSWDTLFKYFRHHFVTFLLQQKIKGDNGFIYLTGGFLASFNRKNNVAERMLPTSV